MKYIEVYNDLQRFLILNNIELSEDHLRKFTQYILQFYYSESMELEDLKEEIEDLQFENRNLYDEVESLNSIIRNLQQQLKEAA